MRRTLSLAAGRAIMGRPISLQKKSGFKIHLGVKSMSIPRDVKLKIIQDVYKKWQEIYGDRDDAEAEAANYEMIDIAMAEAEILYKDRPSN